MLSFRHRDAEGRRQNAEKTIKNFCALISVPLRLCVVFISLSMPSFRHRDAEGRRQNAEKTIKNFSALISVPLRLCVVFISLSIAFISTQRRGGTEAKRRENHKELLCALSPFLCGSASYSSLSRCFHFDTETQRDGDKTQRKP